MLDTVIDTVVTLLMMPLNAIIFPIDLLLSNIPGIEAVAIAIHAVVSYVGVIPEMIVHLTGVNPFLWNLPFLLFVLWMFAAPTINIIKKVWAFFRP